MIFQLYHGCQIHYKKTKLLTYCKNAKGVIRNHKSKKNRQYNDQKIKDKRTTSDLQNTTQKIKDRVTRTNPTKFVKYYLLHILHMARLAYNFLLLFSIIN